MSVSLTMGMSYLPHPSVSTPAFIAAAATAIGDNPKIAMDIALAATDHLLNRAPVSDEVLRAAMALLVSEATQARDDAEV
ncbi:hypothetical protein [Cupriavidus malaysiensis]|uniref:DUF3077 domain-containing protein n=1 Tax=Cupriavidus malaysiensis TaxID=367825 RepID=A0ABN4TZF7_9BURK|nr:hypothetical protein [Cupriavidus malaysiensis]AOZ11130.1 hypothetical protein BKK80_34805 [Cupriavidus malaysiensis]